MPGLTGTESERRKAGEEAMRRLDEHRSTWRSRAESDAKRFLESKDATASQKRSAESVLALGGMLTVAVRSGKTADAAYWAGLMMMFYERMGWQHYEEAIAKAKGGKGLWWGPHYVELPGKQKAIAKFVQHHPGGSIRDLFPIVWNQQYRPRDKAHDSKLGKILCEMNKTLAQEHVGQIHVDKWTLVFDEWA